MMRVTRRRYRRATAAGLLIGALGVLGVASVAAPSGAQEPTPSSTTAPEPPPDTTTTVPAVPTDPPGTTPDTTDTTDTTTTDGTTGTTEPTPPAAETPTTVPDSSAQDAPPAPAAATVTLDPPGDLVDGTPVTVTASGLPAHQWVEVYQCIAGSQDAGFDYTGCDFRDFIWGETDGAGTISLTVRVDAMLTTGFDGPVTTDCRAPGACSVVLFVSGLGSASTTVEAPLPFTPDGPLAPPPTVAVAPADMLTDGQPVTVTGSGLVWSSDVLVLQCAAEPTSLADCDTETRTEAQVDETGSLVVEHRATAVVYTATGEVDCREPGSCVVAVTTDWMQSAQRRAVAPLTFAPDTPVITPTLTASPDADLVDGQVVAVTGSGYLSTWVEVYLCGPTPSYENCLWTESWAEIDESGAFTAEVMVETIIPTQDGDVDCRTSPDPCLLVASSSGPDSGRAGRAELHFAPDGPVPPAPSITVDPATDLPDEATVTVSGANYRPDRDYGIDVRVCSVTDAWLCDPQAQAWVSPAADGSFTVDLDVAATFTPGTGEEIVDCRAAPGCQVVAESRGRRVTAPLSFGPAPPAGERYLDPVFDEVEVTHDVVYRHTTDAAGAPVDLALDVYQPAGDTEARRPVVAWLHGGWFGWGDKAEMAGYAEAFARRGYVAVSMEYRRRPGLGCCPTDDAAGVTAAILDAGDDAAAGVAWLRDHAEEYRIDPDAIAAGGVNGGATAAFNLAHIGGQMDRPAGSPVAAALPIAGVDLGRPDAGEAPVLAFHGTEDDTAPLHLSQSTCRQARRLGGRCDAVGYAGVYDVAEQRQRDIIRRSSDFLAEVMLDPLGYVDWEGPSDPGRPPASTVTAAAVARVVTGMLPRTGADVARLAAVGLTLTVLGGTLELVRRRRLAVIAADPAGADPATDSGRVRLLAAAVVALVVVVAGVAVTSGTDLLSSSGDGDSAEEAGGHDHDDMDHGGHDEGDDDAGHVDHDDDAMAHDGMAHDDMDHDGDHDEMDHADVGAGRAAHGLHDGVRSTGGSHGGGHDALPTAAHGHGAAPDPAHQHDPTGTTTPGHQHDPTGTTTPGHQHPPTTVPGDPPDDGFDPDWTPEQTAYAQALIDDTEAGLEPYRNQAILPLLGYQWIFDGQNPGEYQHWIHLSRIVDGRILDPDFPESLVFRDTDDGPVLEAAMYMLPPGYTLATVPPDIAWLPGWHIHDNLCFENGFELVGVTVDGVCPRGNVVVTPPMLHVWTVDTRCGRFAGVDENGLQCHDDHDGH